MEATGPPIKDVLNIAGVKGSDIADEAGVCHSRHRIMAEVGNAVDREKVIIVGGEVRSSRVRITPEL